VRSPVTGDRPRPAIDMVRPQARPAPAAQARSSARPGIQRSARPSTKANNVYTTPEGNILRKTAKGWEQRDQRKWKKAGDAAVRTGVERDVKVRQRGAERSSSFRQPEKGRQTHKEDKPGDRNRH
jgi:hypothetical protein